MLYPTTRRVWIEVAIFTLFSVMLYQFTIGVFVFLLPLQILYIRRGDRFFILSLLVTFCVLAALKTYKPITSGQLGDVKVFLLTEFFTLGVLMGGLYFVDTSTYRNWNTVQKHLGIAAVVGILSAALIHYVRGQESFIANIDILFSAISEYLKQLLSQNQILQSSLITEMISAEVLKQMASDLFYRSYLFIYFAILMFFWWTGSILGCKSLQKSPQITKIKDFKLNDHYLWFFIGIWAIILVFSFTEAQQSLRSERLNNLAKAVWNGGLILLLLYGLQGLGILKFLMDKFHISRALRFLLIAVMVILLLSPRINVIFIFLIPGLGISETWIKYRIRKG